MTKNAQGDGFRICQFGCGKKIKFIKRQQPDGEEKTVAVEENGNRHICPARKKAREEANPNTPATNPAPPEYAPVTITAIDETMIHFDEESKKGSTLSISSGQRNDLLEKFPVLPARAEIIGSPIGFLTKYRVPAAAPGSGEKPPAVEGTTNPTGIGATGATGDAAARALDPAAGPGAEAKAIAAGVMDELKKYGAVTSAQDKYLIVLQSTLKTFADVYCCLTNGGSKRDPMIEPVAFPDACTAITEQAKIATAEFFEEALNAA